MKSTCDICGRDQVMAIVMLEGAKLAACGRCSSHGKVLYKISSESDETKTEAFVSTRPAQQTEELAENFAKIIRSKRESLGLPLPVIAERINEKESYLENIERGHMRPTLAVAKKLEHELGIKLIEMNVEEAVPAARPGGMSNAVTLADFVVFDKKKK